MVHLMNFYKKEYKTYIEVKTTCSKLKKKKMLQSAFKLHLQNLMVDIK